MSRHVDTFLRLVLVLVLAYLLFTNASGAVSVIRQGGNTTAGVIKTLQGR